MIYDAESDKFSFNEVIGLYRGDKQKEIVERFKLDRFCDVISIFKWTAVLIAVGWATYKIGSWGY